MQLFVLRHGQAEPYASSDRTRNLTSHGREQVRLTAQASLQELQRVDAILASPYTRTQQTAELLRQTLVEAQTLSPGQEGCDSVVPAIEPLEQLTPDSCPSQVHELLGNRAEEVVLLVSHQPLVGSLVNGLCGAAAGFHPMSPSSLACLQLDIVADDMAQLCWLRHEY